MGSNSSKSVPCQAQVQVQRKCETCKTDKDVYYKCDQCLVYTCKSCSIIHQQAPPSHKIKEIGYNPQSFVQQATESKFQALSFTDRECSLCQTYLMFKYKCPECLGRMCFKCSIIHQQLLHSTNNTGLFSTTERLACKIHKKELIIKFCYSCLMKPVCSECISAHKNHQLLSLKDQTSILKGRLSKDLTFTSIVEMKLCEREMRNEWFLRQIESSVRSIKNMKEVNYIKLIRKLQAQEIELDSKFKIFRSNLSHFSEILRASQSKLQAAKAGNNEDNITTVLLEILRSLPQFHFLNLMQNIEYLIPKKTIETVRSIGIENDVRKINPINNIHIELIMSYETNFNSIKKIITLNHQKALITDHSCDSLSTLHINDNIVTSKHLSITAMDMSVTPNKEILLNFNKSDTLHQLTDEDTELFLSVTPHQVLIHCVHVTKNNEIILGVEDYSTKKSSSEDKEESNTKLMIFGMDKKQKQSFEEFQYTPLKKRLFTSPYRITSNIHNEILVIDKMSSYDGRVMALDRKGKVRWIYQGHPEVNSDYKLFDPLDIVTTKEGQAIITDHLNHTLHVLYKICDIEVLVGIKYKCVKEQGIMFPMSLAIDPRGHLWIGCHADTVTKKAKLHIVKLSIR